MSEEIVEQNLFTIIIPKPIVSDNTIINFIDDNGIQQNIQLLTIRQKILNTIFTLIPENIDQSISTQYKNYINYTKEIYHIFFEESPDVIGFLLSSQKYNIESGLFKASLNSTNFIISNSNLNDRINDYENIYSNLNDILYLLESLILNSIDILTKEYIDKLKNLLYNILENEDKDKLIVELLNENHYDNKKFIFSAIKSDFIKITTTIDYNYPLRPNFINIPKLEKITLPLMPEINIPININKPLIPDDTQITFKNGQGKTISTLLKNIRFTLIKIVLSKDVPDEIKSQYLEIYNLLITNNKNQIIDLMKNKNYQNDQFEIIDPTKPKNVKNGITVYKPEDIINFSIKGKDTIFNYKISDMETISYSINEILYLLGSIIINTNEILKKEYIDFLYLAFNELEDAVTEKTQSDVISKIGFEKYYILLCSQDKFIKKPPDVPYYPLPPETLIKRKLHVLLPVKIAQPLLDDNEEITFLKNDINFTSSINYTLNLQKIRENLINIILNPINNQNKNTYLEIYIDLFKESRENIITKLETIEFNNSEINGIEQLSLSDPNMLIPGKLTNGSNIYYTLNQITYLIGSIIVIGGIIDESYIDQSYIIKLKEEYIKLFNRDSSIPKTLDLNNIVILAKEEIKARPQKLEKIVEILKNIHCDTGFYKLFLPIEKFLDFPSIDQYYPEPPTYLNQTSFIISIIKPEDPIKVDNSNKYCNQLQDSKNIYNNSRLPIKINGYRIPSEFNKITKRKDFVKLTSQDYSFSEKKKPSNSLKTKPKMIKPNKMTKTMKIKKINPLFKSK